MQPAGAVPDVRPIAIGEVWNRPSGLCALAALPAVGVSLQLHQLGVGVRGGAQIVGHAVRAGSADPELVTMQVDISNAFNAVSRDAVLAQVFERAPEARTIRRLRIQCTIHALRGRCTRRQQAPVESCWGAAR